MLRINLWKICFLSPLFSFLFLATTLEGQITLDKMEVSCPEEEDGEITVQVQMDGEPADFEYKLSGAMDRPYQFSNHFQELKAGFYRVTVRDTETMCEGSETITLEEPPAVEITGGGIYYICPDDPEEVKLSARLPNCPDCNYKWSNGETGPSITITESDFYQVTATKPGKDEVCNQGFTAVLYLRRDQDVCDNRDRNPGPRPPCPNCKGFRIIFSSDPNEIEGPAGYDSAQWVSVRETLPYTIYFENDPEAATAPARNVEIFMPFDDQMDPGSFRLGTLSFGNFSYAFPPDLTYYSDRLDLRDSLGLYVDVIAGVDIQNNRAFWRLESVDPATGFLSEDPLLGFLPINDTTTRAGEGNVVFTIRPKPAAQTGDLVDAQASITFDINEAIVTNTHTNLIDALPPTSTMDPLPMTLFDDSTHLTWTSIDDPGGVGVAFHDLYVSENAGPFQLHQAGITANEYWFSGQQGSSYAFFVLATDHVGNKEVPPVGAEIEVLLENLITVSARILLQGPYLENTGAMTGVLTSSLIPLMEPYGTGNGELTTLAVLDSPPLPQEKIQDWVLMELRDTETNIVARRAALLQRDGDVVDVDGISPVRFERVPPGDYYILIKHRNHLNVMTAGKVTVN